MWIALSVIVFLIICVFAVHKANEWVYKDGKPMGIFDASSDPDKKRSATERRWW